MRSLTVDPFSFRVVDHKLGSEQVLHSEFGVAPGLAVRCGTERASFAMRFCGTVITTFSLFLLCWLHSPGDVWI